VGRCCWSTLRRQSFVEQIWNVEYACWDIPHLSHEIFPPKCFHVAPSFGLCYESPIMFLLNGYDDIQFLLLRQNFYKIILRYYDRKSILSTLQNSSCIWQADETGLSEIIGGHYYLWGNKLVLCISTFKGEQHRTVSRYSKTHLPFIGKTNKIATNRNFQQRG
jgi:hypothetical protein